MKLSIVSTLYCSARTVNEFCARAAKAAADDAGDSFELILVNDGSPDNCLDLALALRDRHPQLVILDLSRNFGHHKAVMTGLAQARGERIFLLDSDLEEDPELLARFERQRQESGGDVVYGVQHVRKGGWFERASGWVFYRLFRAVTGLNLPSNIVMARLMTRRYVDALVQHQEREIFLAGLWLLTGFKQVPCPIQKHSAGQTTYTTRKKVAQFIDAITSFSNKPLVGIFYFGVLISTGAGAYTLFLLFNKLYFARPLTGWTSVMASIWLLGGLIVSFIGVVGIYLSKIFTETKHRPYTIIRQIYR
jgi:putative glycosyltransferase